MTEYVFTALGLPYRMVLPWPTMLWENTTTPLARNQGRCEGVTLIRHLLNEGLRHFHRGATEVGCLSHALAAHRQTNNHLGDECLLIN